MLAPPRTRLAIDVVFDLVCPWSYLGIRRLRHCLAQRTDISAAIGWQPFLLNPDMDRAGSPRPDYVLRKFGGEDRTQRLHRSIAELGRREGISFRFDLIRSLPVSVNAHRLVRWAAQHGRGMEAPLKSTSGPLGYFDTDLNDTETDLAGEMVERLFAAYFSQGRDIGDSGELARIAEEAGFDLTEALTYLVSPGGAENIHAGTMRAHRLGITGVPCFVIGQRHAIAGAHEPHVFDRLLDVALADLQLP